MTRKWMLIPLAMLIALIPALGCMEEGAPPDETAAKVASLQAKTEANAALITQLQSRVSTVEGRAAGEVTQGELDALAARVAGLESAIADLEAQVEELSEPGSTPSTPTTPVAVTETRWRYDISMSAIANTSIGTDETAKSNRNQAIENALRVSFTKITPLPIREEDIYGLEFAIKNTSDTIAIEAADNVEAIISVVLTPIDSNVKVSKYTDAYQASTPDIWGVWWDVAIFTNPSTGFCRRIQVDSSEFEIRTLGTGKTVAFSLDFNLAYDNA